MGTVRSINRTTALNKIKENPGKFFTVTWVTKAGVEKTVNCLTKKDCETKLGYVRAYVPAAKGYKSIDPRTITAISIAGNNYRIRR